MKKIIIKKKVLQEPVQSISIKLIPALEMEEGVEYAGTGCNTVLMLKKKIPYEGEHTGLLAARSTGIECTIVASTLGNEGEVASLWGTTGVLTECPELIDLIKKQHNGVVKLVQIGNKQKFANIKRPVKLDAEGKVIAKKARGDISATTGYGVGTQGHRFGEIMLANKCSPSTRKICVALIREVLIKDYAFEEKKAQALSQSWYSTLYTRKPHIYAKEWK